jgi:HAD superfamily hydrolase (TIGR01549 family)
MSDRPVALVLFDAVGTLIEPAPPAGEVYRDCARRFGCDVPELDRQSRILELRELARSLEHHDGGTDEHLERFEYTRRLILAMHQVAVTLRLARDLETDEAFEYECWQQVVRSYFADRSRAEADQMFGELWQHFAAASNWRLFPDAAPTIAELQRRGFPIGIASNFDERLITICRGHPALADINPIFVSSQLGWSKPAAGFYQQIERRTGILPEKILLIGDDCDSDYLAPRRLGWQTRWLCRNSAEAAPDQIRSLGEILSELPL